jgi:hypothetical protein
MRKSTKNFATAAAVAAGTAGLAYLAYRQRRQREDAVLQAAASSIVQSIAEAMQVVAPPLRVSREVDNAAASAIEILVNPEWLHAAMRAVCSDAGCQYELAVGILAHELSHVIHGDAFAPPWDKEAIELRADAFAGAAVARLGISPEAFSSIIWQIAQHHSSGPFGYPTRYDRVAAIRQGYETEQERLLVGQYVSAHYIAGQWAALRHYGLAA